MINLCSTMGRPSQSAEIYIDLDIHEESIQLKGLSGFGGFTGRGVVDTKKSLLRIRPGQFREIDMEVLREVFCMTVLSPPRKARKGVRNLLID